MKKEDRARLLIEAIEAVGETPMSYSGRAMYGDRCVAVVPKMYESEASFILAVVADSFDVEEFGDILTALKGSRIDSMGRGIVIYWPTAPWPKDRKEEGNEDDE